MTLAGRFIQYVDFGPANSCWLWNGATRPNGYGQIKGEGRNVRKAHRVAYELFVGDIPEGFGVMHVCDTPACVNPAHLFLGTQTDNMADCAAKRRYSRQLGEAQAQRILALFESGLSQREIARQTGFSRRTVGRYVSS